MIVALWIIAIASGLSSLFVAAIGGMSVDDGNKKDFWACVVFALLLAIVSGSAVYLTATLPTS